MFSLLLVLLAALSINRSQPVMAYEFTVGSWQGEASYDDSGSFTHCMIAAEYVSGIALFFSVSREFQFQIGAYSDDWNLSAGETIDLRFEIDRHASLPVQAEVVGPQAVVVHFDNAETMFDRLRRGYVLTVRGARDSLSFNLTDTYRALNQLVQCASDGVQREVSRRGGNPFAPSRTESVSYVKNLSDQQMTEIIVFVSNVLSHSRISNLTIAAGHQIPEEYSNYDVIWIGEKIVGAATFVPSEWGFDHDQIAALLIAEDSQTCPNDFASGSSVINDGSFHARRLFTACKLATGEAVQAVYYTVLPWSNGFLTISHGTLATGAREEAERTDDALFRAASYVLTAQ